MEPSRFRLTPEFSKAPYFGPLLRGLQRLPKRIKIQTDMAGIEQKSNFLLEITTVRLNRQCVPISYYFIR